MSNLLYKGRPLHAIPDQEISDIYTFELVRWQTFLNGPLADTVPRFRMEQAAALIEALKQEVKKRKLLH